MFVENTHSLSDFRSQSAPCTSDVRKKRNEFMSYSFTGFGLIFFVVVVVGVSHSLVTCITIIACTEKLCRVHFLCVARMANKLNRE